MSTAQQDTEITLGTGRMLAIFFTFVLVCAFFFSIGFSLGRRTAIAGIGTLGIPHPGTPASTTATPTPSAEAPSKPATDGATAAASSAGYYVQVAAVSRQEDAESLVEALKKKQYPAFSANNPTADKFYHVQVGPYPELKDAEAMRARLIGDGYNPIVKK